MEAKRVNASFRDPSGFVFHCNGGLYRQVNESFREHYRALVDSGLYAELTREGLLVQHEEVDVRIEGSRNAYAVLRPEKVPFISYPYEWCFSALKAAALLTLELQKRALNHGLTLRDASAYNVQFLGAEPIFIDTLSFGRYVEGRPWAAYRQFCSHFLVPLALMSKLDDSLGQLLRVHLDGVPLKTGSALLPRTTWLDPGVLMHVHLHAKAVASGPAASAEDMKRGGRRMGKTAILGLVDSLDRTVRKLSWNRPQTLWSTYTDHTNYTDVAQQHKRQMIHEWNLQLRAATPPSLTWDVGANTGVYSEIVAGEGTTVVSFDLDHSAVEAHFCRRRADSDRRILPLLQDLTNPSSGIGWRNGERESLEGRGPADLVLALALIHHLVLTGNVPLPDVAAFFSSIARHLIIEFVPKEDSRVQRMLRLRHDAVHDYSREHFEAAFATYFETIHSIDLRETVRTLYSLKRRDLGQR